MSIHKRFITVLAALALSFAMMVGPALAQERGVQQTGGAAGLVAAVVQANVQDVEVNVVEGDVNVIIQNVLNNNRVLTNLLRDADIDVTVTDVVDVTVVGNVLQINVLSSSNIADLAA